MCLCGKKKWGLTPERCLWIWRCVVCPRMTYGAIVWGTPEALKRDEDRLRSLQRLALILICSARRSTPTRGMEIVLNIPPLHLWIRQVALQTRWRIRKFVPPTWDGIPRTGVSRGHIRSLDNKIGKIIPEGMPVDQTWEILIDRHTKFDLSGEHSNEALAVNIYTDGSQLEQHTGASWMASVGDQQQGHQSHYMGTNSTVFQAEVMAIKLAMDWVNQSKVHFRKKGLNMIYIYVDSKSAIQTLTHNVTKSKTTLMCKNALLVASTSLGVTIRWIKGHANHTGNEVADMLAKKGTHMLQGPGPFTPLPNSEVEKCIEQHLLNKWQHEWNSEITCSQTKLFASHPANSKLSKKLISLDRLDLSAVISWVTGHGNLNRHKHVIDASHSPLCRFCKLKEETPYHLTYECEITAAERIRRRMLDANRDLRRRNRNVTRRPPNLVEIQQVTAKPSQPKRVNEQWMKLMWSTVEYILYCITLIRSMEFFEEADRGVT